MELEFLVEVDGQIQADGFLSDEEDDEVQTTKSAPGSETLYDGEVSDKAVAAKVGKSLLQEQLQAENYRLLQENEALRKEKELVEENHRLLLENTLLRQRCEEIHRAAQSEKTRHEMDGMGNPPAKSPAAPKATKDPQKTKTGSAKPAASAPLQMPPGTLMASGFDLQNAQNSISFAGSLPVAASFPGWWMGLPVQVPLEAMSQVLMAASGEKQLEQPAKTAWHESRADRAQQLFAKQAGLVPGSIAKEKLCTTSAPDAEGEIAVPASTVMPTNCLPEERTTVMLRNLPNNYSRIMLIDLIDSEGFQCKWDFLYLPIDFNTRACLGYAFVNLINHEVACEFMKAFEDFSEWIIPSRKHCIASWSGPHQGLEEHIERYKNSPVMHPAVPDECKPVIFQHGIRMMFPAPTKKVRAPRVRQLRNGER
jgi:regulator of replication initiation timing